jgi:hypothetical protein
MFGFELTISCIASGMLYRYATSMNSLVIGIDSTRYIITRKDWCDFLYLLAAGCRTSGAGPAQPLRSGHDVTGPDINLDFPKPRLDAKHWKLSDGSGPPPD